MCVGINFHLNRLILTPPPPGLVADCPLTNYTPSTCSPSTTDNDGLWTSLLVAAEAFRYGVTKDVFAKNSAWNLFKGMQFLVDVSPPNSSIYDNRLWL